MRRWGTAEKKISELELSQKQPSRWESKVKKKKKGEYLKTVGQAQK